MATVINNPSNGEETGGVAGMIIGIIILIVAIVLFFVYVLPGTRGTEVQESAQTRENIDVNVTLPTTGNTDPVEDTDN